MINRRFILTAIVVCALSPLVSGAPQAKYDYYLTGNAADATGDTTLGIGLMGGGTDVDALFTWMSERAGGGDFVVIRASGADGYNQYVYDLGDFDSVETLVLKNREASYNPFVLQTIRNAEALFIAGGDQSNYVNFWKGTPVEDAIHELAAREIPIAGTSAGTAILTEFVYAAQRQSAVSSKSLADPFNSDITLDRDFLHLPHMSGLISDQHLIERDRLGRTLAFMARIVQDGWQAESRSIAIDRETAVLVDARGDATIVANADHVTPYAYFIRGGRPEVCQPKTPLTYRNLQVFRAQPGSRFDIPSWSGHNGTTYSLDVVNGVITSTQPGGSIY
ncbi:MAG TPA: cyanophycinase [Vicinamibacterales bacterium]|nr:cyanophycinase [Vicinamibacterales bacterium]